MKKIVFLAAFYLAPFQKLNAQYYWQVQSVNSITNGGTYSQNSLPNEINLNIHQCAGGIRQPHNLTNYTLTWYVNSINSNTGGTIVSFQGMQTTSNFDPTLKFTPPTNVVGTFYYYAVFTNPSMTTCGFSNSLVSPTVEVIINSPTLAVSDINNKKSNLTINPNPAKNFININNLQNGEKYFIYNTLGEKVSEGTASPNKKINVNYLNEGLYFLKLENLTTLKFIKE